MTKKTLYIPLFSILFSCGSEKKSEKSENYASEDRFLQPIAGTSGTASDDNVTLQLRQNFQNASLLSGKEIPKDILFIKCIEKEAGIGRAEASEADFTLKWNNGKYTEIKEGIWGTYRYSDNNLNQLIGQKQKPRGDGLTKVIYLRKGAGTLIWGERVLRPSVARTAGPVKELLQKYQERYEVAAAFDLTGVEAKPNWLALSYFACHYQRKTTPSDFTYNLPTFNDIVGPFIPKEEYWKVKEVKSFGQRKWYHNNSSGTIHLYQLSIESRSEKPGLNGNFKSGFFAADYDSDYKVGDYVKLGSSDRFIRDGNIRVDARIVYTRNKEAVEKEFSLYEEKLEEFKLIEIRNKEKQKQDSKRANETNSLEYPSLNHIPVELPNN